MPGFWESLGQGLETAGGILSPDVYEAKQRERLQAVPRSLQIMQLQEMQRRQSADEQFRQSVGGLRNGTLQDSGSMFKVLQQLPPDVIASSPAAQQYAKLASDVQAREAQQENQRQALQFRYDNLKQISEDRNRAIDERAQAARDANAIRVLLAQLVTARTTSPGLTDLSSTDLKSISWEDLAKKAGIQIPASALEIASTQYALTGQMPRAAWGAQGNPQRNAYEAGRAKIAAMLDMSADEIATKPAEWKANAASYLDRTKRLDAISTTLSSFHNNIATYNSLAEGKVPAIAGDRIAAIGEALKSPEVDFTDSVSVNNLINRIKVQFNDPATVAYVTAATAVAADYARILSSQGLSAAQVHVAAGEKAKQLINAGYNKQARQAMIGALESDTEGQRQGLVKQRAEIRKRMGLGSAAPTEAPASQVPVAAPSGDVVDWGTLK